MDDNAIKKYTLTLTENQLLLIRDCLEEYFRIRINQWGDLADSLAMKNKDLSPDNPNHEKIFDGFISDRDAVKKVLECAGRILWEYGENSKTEEQLIAEDMWHVIKHELWKAHGSQEDWTVDSREPMRLSCEPLPELKCE